MLLCFYIHRIITIPRKDRNIHHSDYRNYLQGFHRLDNQSSSSSSKSSKPSP